MDIIIWLVVGGLIGWAASAVVRTQGGMLLDVVAGIVGAAAHVLAQPASIVPVVGASGAIAGVMGAYLVMYPNAPITTVFLAFPFVFFSLDAGFRSIDVHTLTEASHSLGARWGTTLLKVILPNIRSAALAASFLTLAVVMGEFTIANLAAFHTFPIFLQYVNESQGFPAASLTLLSFGITWAAMASLLVVGRKRGQKAAIVAGAR